MCSCRRACQSYLGDSVVLWFHTGKGCVAAVVLQGCKPRLRWKSVRILSQRSHPQRRRTTEVSGWTLQLRRANVLGRVPSNRCRRFGDLEPQHRLRRTVGFAQRTARNSLRSRPEEALVLLPEACCGGRSRFWCTSR